MGQQETLLHTELTSMRTKQAEIDEEMAKMGDVEGHKNELRAQGRVRGRYQHKLIIN
jgi:hypothetical protein